MKNMFIKDDYLEKLQKEIDRIKSSDNKSEILDSSYRLKKIAEDFLIQVALRG